MRGGRAAELVAVLILALGTWLGFATAGPPPVVPATAPDSAFSAERAMHDLQVITTAPHALASAEHDRIRDYLVDRLRALGLEDVHVQSATGFNTLEGPLAATVANVVARKRGTHGGPAIVLSAHYDAVPRSFGAGDDGVGVAAILETVRALAAGPPLDRDLIVTLVDAEEEGLLGSEAFVNLHPWAKDAGVVLNFEGRGNIGPVYMFQTSPGNASLIAAVAQVRRARTNSLTGEVYRHLPSDTDLGSWLHSPFAVGALNFAHIDGFTHYHTPIDNLATLDPRVLQQMGEYALSLTRTLGASDLTRTRTGDEIYFDAPLIGVVHYPASWALIVNIDAFALVLLLVVMGWYRRTLTLRGVGYGALGLLLTLAIPTVLTWMAWRMIMLLHPTYHDIIQGNPYNASWYLLSAGAFTVACALTIQRRIAERATTAEMGVAPMLLFGITGLVVARILPGASWLFCWPLFAATMCASWWRRTTSRGKPPGAWLALFAIPTLVLWPPLIAALEVALTAAFIPACALMLGLILSLVVMPLQLAGNARRWMAAVAAAVAIVAVVRAEITSGFNAERKHPDSLSYFVDADSARAWWITFDRAADRWTSAVLGSDPSPRDVGLYGFARRAGATLAAPAERPVVGPAPVQLIASEPAQDGQRVRLHVARTGPGEFAAIYGDSTRRVNQMRINGRAFADGDSSDRYVPRYHAGRGGTILRYFGVPEEGIDVEFTVTGAAPVILRVITGTEGLPATVSPRPADFMSKPFVPTDMTLTAWTIRT